EKINELFNDIISFSNKQVKRVLVVEDNELESSQIAKMLETDITKIDIATSAKKALKQIGKEDYDCIILDYSLPDMAGNEMVNKVAEIKPRLTPIIIYSAKDFNKVELNVLNRTSNAILAKGVDSLEQLLEEVVLHLHINYNDLPNDKRRLIENRRMKEDILTGKNILVRDESEQAGYNSYLFHLVKLDNSSKITSEALSSTQGKPNGTGYRFKTIADPARDKSWYAIDYSSSVWLIEGDNFDTRKVATVEGKELADIYINAKQQLFVIASKNDQNELLRSTANNSWEKIANLRGNEKPAFSGDYIWIWANGDSSVRIIEPGGKEQQLKMPGKMEGIDFLEKENLVLVNYRAKRSSDIHYQFYEANLPT
ncbi:MAG: response regulator, partial [Chitinophagaceae bacterium]